MLLTSLLLLKGLKCSSVYMITCLIGKLNLIFCFLYRLKFCFCYEYIIINANVKIIINNIVLLSIHYNK